MPSPRSVTALTCLLCWHLVSVPGSAWAAEVDPARLWLPASSDHLRPYLRMAVDDALQDEACTEILYARLNEYRTLYEEPTFTVLCRRDYHSTFNKIYPVTALAPDYNEHVVRSTTAVIDASSAAEGLESLRRMLAPDPQAGPAPDPLSATPDDALTERREDPNDLDLELPPATEVVSDPTLELDLQPLSAPVSEPEK